jgi:hypothetical protein
VGVVAIETGGDPPMQLEFAETALDQIALSVEMLVVPVSVVAVALGGNDRLHSFGSDEGANRIGIVAFVGNHRLGGLSRQQRRSALAVGLLPTG